MASDKQMAYIKKLNNWKQAELDLGEVSRMDDTKASQLIDELKARKSVKQDEGEVGTPRFNKNRAVTGRTGDQWKIQAGMAKKDVYACFARYGRSTTDKHFKDAVVAQWKCYNEIDVMINKIIDGV